MDIERIELENGGDGSTVITLTDSEGLDYVLIPDIPDEGKIIVSGKRLEKEEIIWPGGEDE